MAYYEYRKQPFRTVYITYQFLSTLLFRLPLWFVTNIPRSKRPQATWSLKRVLRVKILKQLMHVSAKVGPNLIPGPNHTAIHGGPEDRGIWVEDANSLVVGDLKRWAEIAGVASIRTPAYWTHKLGSDVKTGAPAEQDKKVILHFHGGGYTALSAHPSDLPGEITKGFANELKVVRRVLSLEYRLASGPPFKAAHPFPTQLLDALAGYNHLVSVCGFSPENIILSGDSAGGNLALALTRYLTEYQGSVETYFPAPPGALILLSPWCDIGPSHSSPEGSAVRFLNSDYIGQPESDVPYIHTVFSSPHGHELLERNAYISPASLHPELVVDFKKYPATFIVCGGAEVFYDAIATLKDRMIKDLGDKVRYYEAPDAVHNYLMFTWHEPERTDTLIALDKWLGSL